MIKTELNHEFISDIRSMDSRPGPMDHQPGTINIQDVSMTSQTVVPMTMTMESQPVLLDTRRIVEAAQPGTMEHVVTLPPLVTQTGILHPVSAALESQISVIDAPSVAVEPQTLAIPSTSQSLPADSNSPQTEAEIISTDTQLKSERKLLEVIQESHSTKQWCDVTIQYKGGALPCHKFVLGTASPVLRAIFLRSKALEETENIVFDGRFQHQDIEQLLQFVYGVSSTCPKEFQFLFPEKMPVKPDIKPEPENQQQQQQQQESVPYEELWDDELWDNRRHDTDLSYKFDQDMDYEQDEDEEEDDEDDDADSFIDDSEDLESDLWGHGYKSSRSKKSKSYKQITTPEGRKRYKCPYCDKLVNKLPKHVFSTHKEDWPDFDSNRRVHRREKKWPKPCPHCQKMMNDKWHYDRHLLTHTDPKERKKREPKKETGAEEYGSFICTKVYY